MVPFQLLDKCVAVSVSCIPLFALSCLERIIICAHLNERYPSAFGVLKGRWELHIDGQRAELPISVRDLVDLFSYFIVSLEIWSAQFLENHFDFVSRMFYLYLKSCKVGLFPLEKNSNSETARILKHLN